VAEVLWAPFDLVLDTVAGCLWPLLQVAMLPARAAAALAGCAGTLLSATYNFSKDIWETMSSIFELNHMSEAAQQSAFDMSQIKTLWNDLFSQVPTAAFFFLKFGSVPLKDHKIRYIQSLSH